MLKRIITGFLLAAGSIAMIIWGAFPLTLEVLTVALIGMNEFTDLAYRQKIRPSRTMAYFGVIVLIAYAYLGNEEYLSPMLLGITLITMLFYLFRKGFHISSFQDVGVAVLGIIYLGWFFCYIILLRKLQIPGTNGNFKLFNFSIEQGAGFVLLLIISTSFTDIGAYFVGKFFGKHKLSPSISPGKTVEGFVGGILGAMLGAWLIGSQLPVAMNDYISIGALCGIFAQLGDLWESILKRDVHVKDSGTMVAGHGGILDRFDSVLFTAPIVYFYVKYFIL